MNNGNSSTDEGIIKRVLCGETDSFKSIVKQYQAQIFSIGMRFLKNEDDAYDFAQEVFLKAFNNLNSYRGESEFRFWLFRVAYNHGINSVKKILKEERIIEESLADKDLPERIHVREEIKETLLKAIEKLPDAYRICLDFYFFFGLSYIEISKITGFPVNTIKSNVFRAKQILRDSLRGTIAEDYYEMQ